MYSVRLIFFIRIMFSTYYFTETNAFRRKLENIRLMIFWNFIRIAWSLWEGNDVLPVKIYILTAVFSNNSKSSFYQRNYYVLGYFCIKNIIKIVILNNLFTKPAKTFYIFKIKTMLWLLLLRINSFVSISILFCCKCNI